MNSPLVSVVMGSASDSEVVKECTLLLEKFGISYEKRILSAHRTPKELIKYIEGLEERGIEIVVAAAGKSAHLPGVIASHTFIPVIGIPMETSLAGGLDSLLSISQMPAGVPVATMGIGKSGCINAAILSLTILSLKYPEFRKTLELFREKQKQKVLKTNPK